MCELLIRVIASRITKQDYQAGLPSRITKQDYQDGLPRWISRQDYQAGLAGRITWQDYLAVYLEGGAWGAWGLFLACKAPQEFLTKIYSRRPRQFYQKLTQWNSGRDSCGIIPGMLSHVPSEVFLLGIPAFSYNLKPCKSLIYIPL
jgi:hypothetical protein